MYQQPPVPGGWGNYGRVNLTTELNYKPNYAWQITVHDTKYTIYIYIERETQKITNLCEYYLVCNGSIYAAGGVAQPKMWINNLLLTRYD